MKRRNPKKLERCVKAVKARLLANMPHDLQQRSDAHHGIAAPVPIMIIGKGQQGPICNHGAGNNHLLFQFLPSLPAFGGGRPRDTASLPLVGLAAGFKDASVPLDQKNVDGGQNIGFDLRESMRIPRCFSGLLVVVDDVAALDVLHMLSSYARKALRRSGGCPVNRTGVHHAEN